MTADLPQLADKALDALDYDYGGDLAEYLGPNWRQVLRRHILNALDDATAELRDLLARLEWAGGEGPKHRCPACDAHWGSWTPPRHDPGCELAAALAGNANEPPPAP